MSRPLALERNLHRFAMLGIAALFLATACAGSGSPQPAEVGSTHANPSPTPAALNVDNAKWVLHSLDGRPIIAGSFATLTLNKERFSGFDGCNTFGGRHGDGTLVADPDGTFTTPTEFWMTAIGCVEPEGVLEQAETYMMALLHSNTFRLANDSLQLQDEWGDVQLVFRRAEALPGTPARLEGTSWRLLTEDTPDDEARVPTLTFPDHQLAEGATACRSLEASYSISGNSIGFPYLRMKDDSSSCSEESRREEGQFTDDLSYAAEYSVYLHEGVKRLVLRTSRGRTLTFEALLSRSP